MAEQSFRTERDSMGEVKVPKGAYYGAQTQRAVENFPISGIGFPPHFIHALGMVKLAAATANEQLGLLEPRIAGAIRQAAQEVIDGKLDREFVVDIFQTGSGTSINMNANEVIANRALEILGRPRQPGSSSQRSREHVPVEQRRDSHCAALRGEHRGRARAAAGVGRPSSSACRQSQRNRRRDQDRTHPSCRRHADALEPGVQRLRAANRAEH